MKVFWETPLTLSGCNKTAENASEGKINLKPCCQDTWFLFPGCVWSCSCSCHILIEGPAVQAELFTPEWSPILCSKWHKTGGHGDLTGIRWQGWSLRPAQAQVVLFHWSSAHNHISAPEGEKNKTKTNKNQTKLHKFSYLIFSQAMFPILLYYRHQHTVTV